MKKVSTGWLRQFGDRTTGWQKFWWMEKNCDVTEKSMLSRDIVKDLYYIYFVYWGICFGSLILHHILHVVLSDFWKIAVLVKSKKSLQNTWPFNFKPIQNGIMLMIFLDDYDLWKRFENSKPKLIRYWLALKHIRLIDLIQKFENIITLKIDSVFWINWPLLDEVRT